MGVGVEVVSEAAEAVEVVVGPLRGAAPAMHKVHNLIPCSIPMVRMVARFVLPDPHGYLL